MPSLLYSARLCSRFALFMAMSFCLSWLTNDKQPRRQRRQPAARCQFVPVAPVFCQRLLAVVIGRLNMLSSPPPPLFLLTPFSSSSLALMAFVFLLPAKKPTRGRTTLHSTPVQSTAEPGIGRATGLASRCAFYNKGINYFHCQHCFHAAFARTSTGQALAGHRLL